LISTLLLFLVQIRNAYKLQNYYYYYTGPRSHITSFHDNTFNNNITILPFR
jgi:hypothetical protein